MSLDAKEGKEGKEEQSVPSKHLPLLQRLEHYEGGLPALATVAQLPPLIEAVPCKPLLFDVAFNGVQAPDLMHRLDQKQQEQAARRRKVMEAEEQQMEDESKEEQPEQATGWFGAARGWFGRG